MKTYRQSCSLIRKGDVLTAINGKDKIIEAWLSASKTDLECAELLFGCKKFPQALYHLQQSNEKLAKGLLISCGLLTPKMARKDARVKSLLGFAPKEPETYRHRVTRSFLSDMEKLVPSIEELYKLIENSERMPKIAEFRRTIRKGKKSIQKLKKKPFNLIDTSAQLENEIKAIKNILGNIDQTIDKVSQEIDRLDFEEVVRVAIVVVGKAGLDVNNVQAPSLQEIKDGIISSVKLSVLVTISVTMASFLDPLEAVTRYPDSESHSFNEKNPYITCFKGLHESVALTLEKARKKKGFCG
jgi:hypothetical protein